MTSYKDKNGKELHVGDLVTFNRSGSKGIFLGLDEKGKFLVMEAGKHIDGSEMTWTWELLNSHIQIVENDKLEDVKWEQPRATSVSV